MHSVSISPTGVSITILRPITTTGRILILYILLSLYMPSPRPLSLQPQLRFPRRAANQSRGIAVYAYPHYWSLSRPISTLTLGNGMQRIPSRRPALIMTGIKDGVGGITFLIRRAGTKLTETRTKRENASLLRCPGAEPNAASTSIRAALIAGCIWLIALLVLFVEVTGCLVETC